MNTKKVFAIAMCAVLGANVLAYEYDVRQPSDDLKPTFAPADTQPGKWTLRVDDALAKAKAAGRYTLVLNTASWWCPHCELLEEMVLTSQAWKDYVAANGFYLGMLDFPYRLEVPADQQWKSWRTDLGKGWGFKCWMMSQDYLDEIGCTKEQGLEFIMGQYEWQQKLGEVDYMELITITNPLTKAEFTYGKVGYPSIIVFDPNGREVGRKMFQGWLRQANVTDAEAQEEAIQAIERIINGKCEICEDPAAGTPPANAAQTYDGWAVGANGVAGTVAFKLGKAGRDGSVKVTGSVTVGGKTTAFGQVVAKTLDEGVPLSKGKTAVGTVYFGETGLSGSFALNGATYEIKGGRNVFKAKDAAAKARAASCPKGSWNVVLKPAAEKDQTSAFQGGYGTLNVSVGASGKVRVKGYMADGTAVSVSAQAIVGSDGKTCVPIMANLYSKKGGFGFALWFKDGLLYDIDDVAPWVAAGKNAFVSTYTPMAAREAGYGTVEEELELVVPGLPDEAADIVTVGRTRWVGTEDTSFKATCNAKTGLLTGTMKVVPDGQAKAVTAKFYGAVMSGTGYGTLVVKNVGTWPVKIMLCGSCSD